MPYAFVFKTINKTEQSTITSKSFFNFLVKLLKPFYEKIPHKMIIFLGIYISIDSTKLHHIQIEEGTK